jgi:hypothetical protein
MNIKLIIFAIIGIFLVYLISVFLIYSTLDEPVIIGQDCVVYKRGSIYDSLNFMDSTTTISKLLGIKAEYCDYNKMK